MSFRPSNCENWELNWIRSEFMAQQFKKNVWNVINEIKFKYLRRLIPDRGLGLEVGCGTASLLGCVARLGWKVIGIDYSPVALKIASTRFCNIGCDVNLLRGDAYNLPLKDRSFNLVMSTGLLEHFDDPRPVIAEMVRVLCTGGIFYSDIVPRKFSLLRALDKVRFCSRGKSEIDIYERTFSKSEIETMFAGIETLKNVSISPAGIFLPRKLFSKKIPFTHQMEYPISKVFGLMLSGLDGTWIADFLGLYYLVSGTKI